VGVICLRRDGDNESSFAGPRGVIPVDAPWHYTTFLGFDWRVLELEREIVAREFGACLRGNVPADTLWFSLRSIVAANARNTFTQEVLILASDSGKLKAREELVRLTDKELEKKFSSLNAKQQSVAATKFYIREIRNPVSAAIAEEDITFGVVDGGNDLGCDFIYRDDGRVLIVQSKYRNSSATEDPKDISHFKSIFKRLRDDKLNANKLLKESLSEISWSSDQFELVYVCFSKIGPQARALTEQQADYPPEVSNLEDRSDWKFLDETDLNIELRNARSFQSGLFDKSYELFPEGSKGRKGESVISIDAGGRKSYVLTLPASQLVNAYKALGQDVIFSLNIRNFIGNSSTNRDVIKTALEEPENFYLFNNGISCLATKVDVSEKSVNVVGLQVINGAQTVKSLVHTSRKWKDVPLVLVRITEISEGYGSGGKIRDQITKYNNTQNTIKISDFRSNDLVQDGLRMQFENIVRNGRKVSYLPKRTDRVPPHAEIVRLEEFAKSVFAFLFDPTEFTGSSSFLFDTSPSGGYTKVFGDGTAVWDHMPEDEFEFRAAAYWIAQDFGSYLREAREAPELDADARASLERKWLLVYAAAKTLEYFYGSQFKAQVRKLHRGNWSVTGAPEEKKNQLLLRVFQHAKSGVITAYRNAKQYQPDFEHRKWIRSKETPKTIRDVLVNIVLPAQPPLGDIQK
jgi:AIPR protein